MNAQTFVSKTRSILSDNAGRRTIGRQASGPRLDGGRVAMLGAGDYRVFRKKADHKFKAWHVEILVDCSGSIQRDRRTDALVDAVMGIHRALLQAQIGKINVMGINRDEIDLNKLVLDRARFRELIVAFREGGASDLGYAEDGGAGTHDGYFIRKATQRMLAEHAPGKILLVFTDGQPACDYNGHGCSEGCGNRDQLRQDQISALGEARKAGIKALGVGIQADHVAQFYGSTYSVSVNNLPELFTKSAQLLEKNIIRG